MITFVVFSLKRAWQGFWRNAVMSIAATATMVLMLLLLAGFWIIQTGLLAGLQFTEQKVEVVAYLQTNSTIRQVTALQTQSARCPRSRRSRSSSRDAGARRLPRASLKAQGREDLTPYLDTNPLHASLEVKLADPNASASSREALRDEPIVRNVINIEDLVDRVLTVTDILRTAGTVVLLVVGVIALFIIVNTIRLAVVARAEEIEIMRLVGASDAFIRWPFVFEGRLRRAARVAASRSACWPPPPTRSSGFMVDFFRVLPLQFGTLSRDLVVLVLGAGVGLGIARVVGLGPHLPHPLTRAASVRPWAVSRRARSAVPSARSRLARWAVRAAVVRFSPVRIRHPEPAQDGQSDAPRRSVRRRRDASRHRRPARTGSLPDRQSPSMAVPTGRLPGRRRARPLDRDRPGRDPDRRRAVHVGLLARPPQRREQPGTRRRPRSRRSSRSGTRTTRSRTGMPAATSTDRPSSRARSGA